MCKWNGLNKMKVLMTQTNTTLQWILNNVQEQILDWHEKVSRKKKRSRKTRMRFVSK